MMFTVFTIISIAWAQTPKDVEHYLELLEYRQHLKAFYSDGCSQFPEEKLKNSKALQSCCVDHDIKYWAGGTRQQRKQADKEFKLCVEQAHSKELALAMYKAVRLGGKPNSKTGYRWGYGWSFLRPYGKLTPYEIKQVQQLTPQNKKKHPCC